MLPIAVRFTAIRRMTAARPLFPTTTMTTTTAITPIRSISSAWDDRAAPPRLPPEEQAEFERLVRQAQESAAAASLADAVAAANAKAEAEVAAAEAAAAVAAEAEASAANATTTGAAADTPAQAPAQTPASALNGNPIEGVWRGAPPEFDGDRNPKTGEVGGPKNEPLRWGSSGDWSFNGRVTDF
ncbi:hypothetical protein SCUCBS95973_006071 [Sporothrix curviconia]|uniref:Succinate dehydrogenase assembly factor 4, mitochondrial n=1 Tax=Sporothrix curviconia TaxID=1260050 RepID=A0ABP0C2H4_9PEZI